MNDDLERLIAAMARHQAHHDHRSLAAATRQIRDLVAEARAGYRAAGAPYGDDDQGFGRWLLALASDSCCVAWRAVVLRPTCEQRWYNRRYQRRTLSSVDDRHS